jgi:hypothetical protein
MPKVADISRDELVRCWNRVTSGQTTLLAERKALGFKTTATLSKALKALLGASVYSDTMRGVLWKRKRKPIPDTVV